MINQQKINKILDQTDISLIKYVTMKIYIIYNIIYNIRYILKYYWLMQASN